MSGVIGGVFAVILSFAVSRYILDIDWSFDLATTIAGIAATTLLVTIVGVAASFDVLFRRPITTLRSQ
jgi:predicted lysophospholipase L1 biosynthesis ABC-type transport system permease subunit